MKIIVSDNLGRNVTHEREWYINTDGKIFYYTGDIDCPLYVVDNGYTFEVDQKYNEWQSNYLGEWIGLESPQIDYPSCCDGCSNNPKNGGSGICNCTLPYMSNPVNYNGTPDVRNYMYYTTNATDLNSHKANSDRIAEAVERTQKYIRKD